MVGDPVDITEGNTFETYPDISIGGSIAPLTFTRYYVSNDDAWSGAENEDYLGNYLGYMMAPFGTTHSNSIRWYDNYFSFVMIASGNTWVRDRTGSLLKFGDSSHLGAVPYEAGSQSLRDILVRTDSGYILYQEDGTKLYFDHVFPEYTNAYLLSSIEDNTNTTIATLIYSDPVGIPSCPAVGTISSPYISEIDGADGQKLTFQYEALNQYESYYGRYDEVECVIHSISVTDRNSSASHVVATYTYQTDADNNDEQTPGLLASAQLPDKTIDYANPPNEFIASIDGTRITDHTYSADTGAILSSTANHEDLQFGPNIVEPTPNGDYWVTQATDNAAQRGDGLTNSDPGPTYNFFLETQYPELDEGRFSWLSMSTPTSTWYSPIAPHNEWKTTSNQKLSPSAYYDGRGGWTNFGYTDPDSSISGSNWTELRSVDYGAVNDQTTGLLHQDRTYAYYFGIHEQRMVTQSSSSTIFPLLQATTHENYTTLGSTDSVVHTSTIRHGWTIDSNGNSVERYVGTFYLTRHTCSQLNDPDPQLRILEVHGPCIVTDANATDCSGTGIVPVTQYWYNSQGQGNDSGQLFEIRRYVDSSAWPSSCAPLDPVTPPASDYLSVGFRNYDASGNPGIIIDPNGNTIQLWYAGIGSHLLAHASTNNNQFMSFTYDNGMLSSVLYPLGNYEVFCHRSGTTNAGCSGAWSDRLQWRAKSAVIDGSTWSEKIYYEYWPDGTVKTEKYLGECTSNCTSSSGELRKIQHYADNAYRQPTYAKAGDGPVATYRQITQFNGEGDITAVGSPYNNPPDFCGSINNVSNVCQHLQRDLMGRIHEIDSPQETSSNSTSLEYDPQGHVKYVHRGCTGGNCDPTITYQYDDFGNLVSSTLPWTGTGGVAGITRYVYDAAGNLTEKVLPGAQQWFTYYYDALSRPTRKTAWTAEPGLPWSVGQVSWYYDQSFPATGSCPSPATSQVMGRLQRMIDSFGSTWYTYDQLGQLTGEIRDRTNSTCGTASGQQSLSTLYTRDANENITSITYPYGRKATYTYGTGAKADRVSSVQVSKFDGANWVAGDSANNIYNVTWEPYGGLSHYDFGRPDGWFPSHIEVDYALGDDGTQSTSSCPGSMPSSANSDHTGRLRGLWVTHWPAFGSVTDIYRRTYAYQGDQVKQIATCLLNTTQPQIESYTYDRQLELTSATGPLSATIGGSFGSWYSNYSPDGERTGFGGNGYSFYPYYGSLDHLTQLESSGGALQYFYTYDALGSETGKHSMSDSTGPTMSYTFYDSSGNEGSSDSTFRAVDVDGSYYNYYYDGWMNRRLKDYPVGDNDEYFHAGSRLLVDQGNAAQTGAVNHPVDDYIWLGGRPIEIVHGSLNSQYQRLSDTGTTCSREGDGSDCGTYFPITDHVGKPVLMLDNQGRIRGVGEYDPLGNLNRVSYDRETPHSVTVNGTYNFANINQPLVAGLKEDIRAHVVGFDPNCSGNNGNLVAYANFTTPGYAWSWGSCHLGDYWFPWLPSSNGTATLNVVSNQNTAMWGEVVDNYEYRRYQSGVKPFWTPLRMPGQYHDEETDLNQNHNRFYDGLSGRYTAAEPLWQTPAAVLRAAYMGMQAPVYGYAGNNPLNYIDRSGLFTVGIVFNGSFELVADSTSGFGGFFGHNPDSGWTSGWSWGFLGWTGAGGGGPASASACVGVQVTSAKTVSQLKGLGVSVGGSGGEGLSFGGGLVGSDSYKGGELSAGVGFGVFPGEGHSIVTVTGGYDSDTGWNKTGK